LTPALEPMVAFPAPADLRGHRLPEGRSRRGRMSTGWPVPLTSQGPSLPCGPP